MSVRSKDIPPASWSKEINFAVPGMRATNANALCAPARTGPETELVKIRRRAFPAGKKGRTMTKNGNALVRVWIDAATRTGLNLLDQARRQCDHLGPYGIAAKKGQTNRAYRRHGYLRMRFPTRRLARAYVKRLERLGEPQIVWRLMRHRQVWE
ncbi:MAG: hypothetical protein ACXWUZ_03840 [Allosphingosinicella sp.]